MTDELRIKMEELVEESWKARVKKSLGTNTVFVAMNDDYSNGFKDGFEDGFQSCHDMMKKDYDEKLQKLIRQNRDLIYWLNRMSELRWKDSSYAPNFKYCVQELNKTLAEFDSGK